VALPDDISADLAELELEISTDGATAHQFTWNGADYSCVPGSVTNGRALGAGGFSVDADLVLFVRAVHFSDLTDPDTTPEAKETLVFASNTYRIEEVVRPAGDPFLKLVCVHKNRGA
jgi:hypothetical protein